METADIQKFLDSHNVKKISLQWIKHCFDHKITTNPDMQHYIDMLYNKDKTHIADSLYGSYRNYRCAIAFEVFYALRRLYNESNN